MALFSWIVGRKRDFLIEFVDPATATSIKGSRPGSLPRHRVQTPHLSFEFLSGLLDSGDFIWRLDGAEPQLLGLKAKVNLWASRILSQYQARSGQVMTIACLPIAEAAVWPDAVQENILLTLASPFRAQETFSLPIPVARVLSEVLPLVLARVHPSSTA
jgi:hypothetical protein